MSEIQIWYCSIAAGVPYTAVKVKDATYPTATWGKGRALRFASCSIASPTVPTYERFMIEYEDATGVALPERKVGISGE